MKARYPFTAATCVLLAAGLAACGGSSGGSGVVNPEDPNAMFEALSLKFGGGADALKTQGDLPAPTMGGPEITELPEEEISASGTSKSVLFDVDAPSGLSKLFAKVTGGTGLFTAELPEATALTKSNHGGFSFSLQIPSNVGLGRFCTTIAVEDNENRVSEPKEICFNNFPSENDPGAILERLLGTWQGCLEDERVRVTFTKDAEGELVANTQITEFTQIGCTGGIVGQEQLPLSYFIGGPVEVSDGGALANVFDITEVDPQTQQPVGETLFQIIRIEPGNNVFYIGLEGEEPPLSEAQRPTALDFDAPFVRQ